MAGHLSGQTIVITGGTGVLGWHLIEDLIERGVDATHIHILDIKGPDSQIPGSGVSYHHADITSVEDVSQVMQRVKPNVIFHLASPYPFETNRAILESVNITGTRNLISSAQAVGTVAAFIYTSSSSVIHDHYHPLRKADETYPVLYAPAQPNYYSHTKAVAESIVLSANRASNGPRMLTVALRPASMYGERDTTQIPNLIKNARAGRANMRIGYEDNKFDNTYVKNLTYAQLLAAEALLAASSTSTAAPVSNDMRVDGEVFLVTDDDPYTFPAYTRLVAACAGHPVDESSVRTIPLWLMLGVVYIVEWMYYIFTIGKQVAFSTRVVRMLAQERTFDIGKAKKRLGYTPKYSTAEGVRRAVQWFVEQERKKGREDERGLEHEAEGTAKDAGAAGGKPKAQ